LTKPRLASLALVVALATLGVVVALARAPGSPPRPASTLPAPVSTPAPLPPPALPAKTTLARVDGWRFQAGPPPAGWTDPGFDDRGWAGPSPGPFVPRSPARDATAPAATLYDLVPGAPLLLRGRFAIEAPARVRVLELDVAYADGFVATLNGREVARRGLVGTGAVLAGAGPHGPEIDRITIPVPSPAIPELRADANLLAIAVYPFPGRSTVLPRAPAVSVGVASATGVRFTRGPYLAAPFEATPGAGLSVVWRTDLPARGTVIVERADDKPAPPARPRRFETPEAATEQVVKLEGLATGAAYRYRVEVAAGGADTTDAGLAGVDTAGVDTAVVNTAVVNTAVAGPARFATLPSAPTPLRFAVYGDTRYPGHAAHRAVVEALVREAPAVVLMTGDLTDDGNEDTNWQRFFEITAPLGAIAPMVPALGNHDSAHGGAGLPRTWEMFRVPAHGPPGWTSFDLGGVHFVILASSQMRDPEQRRWLVDDLARAGRRHPRAVFAFCHDGPWSHALHGGERIMARDFAPLLAAGHVDVLFAGHDHVYERGAGDTPAGKLTYVVSGGGGAPLYDPVCAAGAPATAEGGGALPPCPASVAFIAKTYHYLMVEVAGDGIRLCPRRPDGSAVEPCVSLPAHR
jgi:predicted phosphodiesterase